MGKAQLRSAQLIAPFGPGSIYTDRDGVPHLVCGLDYWFYRDDRDTGLTLTERIGEFECFDPRLLALLHVDRLLKPPPFRIVTRNQTAPQNHLLRIPAHRFPRWYRNSRTGHLKQFRLDTLKTGRPDGGGRWSSVRFISVCAKGHISDFPWKRWAGCTCDSDDQLFLADGGGSELSTVTVRCGRCKAGPASLSGSTQRATTLEPTLMQRKGISCEGERLWLGSSAMQVCDQTPVAALINQTNIYFPKTISSLRLPEITVLDAEEVEVRRVINEDGNLLNQIRLVSQLTQSVESTIPLVDKALADAGVSAGRDSVLKATKAVLSPGGIELTGNDQPLGVENEMQRLRRQEFVVLRREVSAEMGSGDLVVRPTRLSGETAGFLGCVHLIERLKETRAFVGFDRLEPQGSPEIGLPDRALQQLFRNPPPPAKGERWLPAIEVYGEGLYLELQESFIAAWQEKNSTWLEQRIDSAFIARMAAQHQLLPPAAPTKSWASRYLLVHTLSHALLSELVFECGYSSAALRERLYVSADERAPMAGILLYTAAGDSEGTLGGLVRLGRPESLERIFRKAIARASWCSVDPVCSENLGGQGSWLTNLAACHACALLPETACETLNHGLDRAMLVGTPQERTPGAFSFLLPLSTESSTPEVK